VYCSVDIDGLDPGFAPGTGTMEPFGLAPREARDLVRAVAPAADGFDVVEVNDPTTTTAAAALAANFSGSSCSRTQQRRASK